MRHVLRNTSQCAGANECMCEDARLTEPLALCSQGAYMTGTFACPVCRAVREQRLEIGEFERLKGKTKLIIGTANRNA